ncbi:MAG: hypothetical protein JWL81_3373 [Verrucomicrobiales bacterium]|nr:hypothetical protein [Verrucomicrobiales bacterium]
MTDLPSPKKREGWLGLVLTAILCTGFLYWWFRPARETWEHHSTAQLVARALAEPNLSNPLERLVIDFDLMETAILQARQGMIPEGLETAARIADPVVQARTVRQLAQANINEDSKNLGESITMCERIADLTLRARVKEEIQLQIAMLGFGDVVLPGAKTPLLRARLARRLAETDGQDTARGVLGELEKMLPTLPPAEAAPLLIELAWTHVHLTIVDGPAQAFESIRRVTSKEDQDELWLDLFRVCFGRGDTAAADSALVSAEIKDPNLRRTIELEAIQSNIPIRPAAVILAELQKDLDAAPPGPERIRCLLRLSDAQRRTTGPEASTAPLLTALEASKALTDPVQRATFLAELAEVLPDALLFTEAKQALADATSAARTVVAPDQRLPLLVMILRHAYNAGEIQTAAALAEESLILAPKFKLPLPLLQELTDFLTRLSDWPAALSLLPAEGASYEDFKPDSDSKSKTESTTASDSASNSKTASPAATSAPGTAPASANTTASTQGTSTAAVPSATAPARAPAPAPAGPATPGSVNTGDGKSILSPRRALLDAMATTAAEDIIGYDPGDPPNRGEPLDRIRNRATTDEAAAAAYLPGIPAGYPRARATLAIAKGLLLKIVPTAETNLPSDPSGPQDLLPGQENDPAIPENAPLPSDPSTAPKPVPNSVPDPAPTPGQPEKSAPSLPNQLESTSPNQPEQPLPNQPEPPLPDDPEPPLPNDTPEAAPPVTAPPPGQPSPAR